MNAARKTLVLLALAACGKAFATPLANPAVIGQVLGHRPSRALPQGELGFQ